MMTAPRILIDADACPVKEEVTRVGSRHGIEMVFVANSGLRPSRDPLIRNVLVPPGADVADDWIADAALASDVVITADIPLASRALAKGATVLGPTGRPFTEASIGMALAMRELNQHLRETGESRGLNAGFTAKDRSRFLRALDEAVVRLKRG
jgi:uncharacterized protein YaiI (UPF0178 family)